MRRIRQFITPPGSNAVVNETYSRHAEIPQFDSRLSSCTRQQEHVLRLEISMQDLAIVHMLHGQNELDKYMQNFVFGYKLSSAVFQEVL